MFLLIKFKFFVLIWFFLCHLFVCETFSKFKKKREIVPTLDKSLFTFNGFEKVSSVPVLFPSDICLLNVNGVQYATALHTNRTGEQQLSVFILQNEHYMPFAQKAAPFAVDMDCLSYGGKGYIALAFNLTTEPRNAMEGSPIYQINEKGFRAVQFFGNTHLNSVFLTATADDLLMMQSFNHNNQTKLNCPYYRWAGSSFRQLGNIPCTNARNMDPFAMNHEHYVAVANYADYHGRTSTNSEVYKYDSMKKKFMPFQKILTHGATDVRYFDVPQENIPNDYRHFLVFGNSLSPNNNHKAATADSIIFIYDQNQFVPFQSLPAYNIKQFLPVESVIMEKFLLLVNGENQDIKIHDLNNWRFEESSIQFTEGALSKGISSMRSYQDQNGTFLVIANKLMLENETNIFRPIFKQDENANFLRQKIIDWTKAQKQRLESIDITKLMQEAESKLQTLEQTQSQEKGTVPSFIKTSKILRATTKSLDYPRLNLNKNYWSVLSYANQALDVLESQFTTTKTRSKRHNVQKRDIQVSTLVVQNELHFDKVNELNAKSPIFDKIKTKKLIVNKQFKTPRNQSEIDEVPRNTTEVQHLAVNNLELTGNFNGLKWIDEVLNKTLKKSAPYQFVKSRASIDNLEAQTVFVENDELNNKNINHLVSIESGDYVIEQNVQFAAPLRANKLIINERLDNINVIDGKLDVLLKHANHTQIIQGHKHMQSIKVLEPIMLGGSMFGKELESLSPAKIIRQNLQLQGNYSILGDINVAKLLQSYELHPRSDNTSKIYAKKHLQRAINLLADDLDNLVIDFKMPIKANNSLVYFVNGKDMQNLLRSNTSELQVISGHKKFSNNLHINGKQNDVKILNGINIDDLPANLLLKHTNQTICAPMNFGTIITQSINAKEILLNNSDISLFLTKSTTQYINGSLKAGVLHVQHLNTTYLHTKGKLFNVQLQDIFQQKSKMAPNQRVFNLKHKFYGNIYAENLKMPTKSSLNNKTIKIIERQLAQLAGNMKYVGNFTFNYPMNITQLNFEEQLNGIAAHEFGNCWLQRHGRQVFVAPQTLDFVETPEIILNGDLNQHNLMDLVQGTYWITRDEILPNTEFKKNTSMQGNLYSTLVNGLKVPEDVLLSTAAMPQIFEDNIKLLGHLKVDGKLENVNMINDFPMHLFKQLLNGDQVLHVQNAYFEKPPAYVKLNQHKMQDLLNNVWLQNEDKQIHNIKLEEAHFTGLLNFDETLNGIHIQNLKQNYFSLSREQNIFTQIVFDGHVNFTGQIKANNIQLIDKCRLIEPQSNITFNFSNFVLHTLKKDEVRFITGKWHLNSSTIFGDLNNVQINDLNLAQDVVRFDQQLPHITAQKYAIAANIKQLYAEPQSLVNEVGVADWIQNTVYAHGNNTIMGWTTIDEVNINNDLQVRGSLNGHIFNPDYLFLRDREQTLHGDLILKNADEKNAVLATNFASLFVRNINDLDIQKFLTNQAHLNSNVDVTAHITFMQPVQVEEYQTTDIINIKLKRHATLFQCPEYNETVVNLTKKLTDKINAH